MNIQTARENYNRSGLAVATKQAMRFHFRLTFQQIANLTGVHKKNVTGHVAAKRGANVRRWEDRDAEQQQAAIRIAQDLITAQ